LVIEQPGEYYLRAEYWGYELEDSQSGWPNFLKSNVATIFVEEAKDIDTKVFEMLRGDDGTFKDYAYLVRGALEGNGDPIEKFYEIVHSYPRSAYTPIVRRALIGYFEQRMKSTNKPRLSEKERQMYESLRMQN